jgi:hypothetical protein
MCTRLCCACGGAGRRNAQIYIRCTHVLSCVAIRFHKKEQLCGRPVAVSTCASKASPGHRLSLRGTGRSTRLLLTNNAAASSIGPVRFREAGGPCNIDYARENGKSMCWDPLANLETLSDALLCVRCAQAIVQIPRYFRHPKVGKDTKRQSKIWAHDEFNLCSIGDRVCMRACLILSTCPRRSLTFTHQPTPTPFAGTPRAQPRTKQEEGARRR